MFLHDIKVSINGVPPQWLGQDDKPGPIKKACHENTESERHSKSNDTHNQSTPPQQGGGSKVAGTNMSGPPVFSQSSEVNDLLCKHPTIQLGMVAEAAGFANTGVMPTEDSPPKSCLRWICFEKCTYPRCLWNHPPVVDNAAATTLFRAMLPGINNLRARAKLLTPAPFSRRRK
jgi:hypothetical protein